MKRPTSIGRRIGIHIAILVAALMLIYSLTIDRVYQWGIHDTTHYFLTLEADRALDVWQRTGRLPPGPDGDSQLFADHAHLPPAVQAAFPLMQHREGELLTADIGNEVLYLLPYRYPDTGQFFYVYHVYNAAADDYAASPSVPQLLLLLALGAAALVALLVMPLAWSIITSVRSLEAWATSLQPGAPQPVIPAARLKFTELHAVAHRLQEAAAALARYNQREKSFLRTLSHELRTPLAIVRAALTLLNRKSEELNAAQRRKLDLMQQANDNMLAITECLLWLWTDKARALPRESVDVGAVISDIVRNYRHLLQGKQVNIVVNVPDALCYCVERKLFEMTLGNLVRNAFQYADAGSIEIRADHSAITIRNPVAGSQELSGSILAGRSSEDDYGYGVGLFLVENICTQQGWDLQSDHRDDVFSVTVTLYPDVPPRLQQ